MRCLSWRVRDARICHPHVKGRGCSERRLWQQIMYCNSTTALLPLPHPYIVPFGAVHPSWLRGCVAARPSGECASCEKATKRCQRLRKHRQMKALFPSLPCCPCHRPLASRSRRSREWTYWAASGSRNRRLHLIYDFIVPFRLSVPRGDGAGTAQLSSRGQVCTSKSSWSFPGQIWVT